MATKRLQVKGIEEARNKIEQVAKDQRGNHMVSVYQKATLVLVRQLKQRSPVDTGRLRNSWTGAVSTTRSGLVGIAGTNVHYAPYMNFGTGTFVGRKPHVVKAGHVMQWARRHKANPYVVALAITRRGGLKPRNFVEDSIKHGRADVIKIIENGVSRSVTK